MIENIPPLANCSRVWACNNKGQWFYINHGGTWQMFQGFDAAKDAEDSVRADEAETLLEPFAEAYTNDLEHDAGPLMSGEDKLPVAMKHCHAAHVFLASDKPNLIDPETEFMQAL